MTAIVDVHARQILDSRGNPTVEVDVTLEDGSMGRAAVPSGASTGAHEAVELRDGDKSRWGGKGVSKAVAGGQRRDRRGGRGPRGRGPDFLDRAMIALDGTENKGRLGANAILGVSLATAKAAADAVGLPLYRYVGGVDANLLPTPMMNILNGGVHADNGIDFQEFMVMPVGAPDFAEALRCGAEIFHALKSGLHQAGLSTAVGDEGGFAPAINSAREALDFIDKAVSCRRVQARRRRAARARLRRERVLQGRRVPDEGRGQDAFARRNGRFPRRPCRQLSDRLDRGRLGRRRRRRVEGADRQARRRVCSWSATMLFVTNVKRLQWGIDHGIANSILIKVNQIGTLTETIDAVKLAQSSAYTTVMSHRSGETEDSTIADLAVALSCGQIKTGSLSRSDRIAKYNQLLRIEEELGETARYAGRAAVRAYKAR